MIWALLGVFENENMCGLRTNLFLSDVTIQKRGERERYQRLARTSQQSDELISRQSHLFVELDEF